MTKEDKELLLLTDLCARLPYGVKVDIPRDYPNNPQIMERIDKDCNIIINSILEYAVFEYKPYLRPMSSMTDEERNEWADLFNLELDKLNEIDDEDKAEELAPYYFGKCHQVSIDWLNSHHFDYRGLIEKGLALEAPEDMYK